MTRSGRLSAPGSEQLLIFAAVALVAIVGAWMPVTIGHAPGYAGGGPIIAVIGLLTGKITWTGACTMVLAAEVAILAVLAAAGGWVWRRYWRARPRVDRKARALATRAD